MFDRESDRTPQSLIEELATSRSTVQWERFLFLYQPLLVRWLRSYPIAQVELPDLVQDTFVVVLKQIPKFQHNGRTGAFRKWLKLILHNQVLEHRRHHTRNVRTAETDFFQNLPQVTTDIEQRWEEEHQRELLRRLLQLTKPHVSPVWWEAFYRTAIAGEPTAAVAQELGLTLNAVYIARSRVLAQLRSLSRGLLDADE